MHLYHLPSSLPLLIRHLFGIHRRSSFSPIHPFDFYSLSVYSFFPLSLSALLSLRDSHSPRDTRLCCAEATLAPSFLLLSLSFFPSPFSPLLPLLPSSSLLSLSSHTYHSTQVHVREGHRHTTNDWRIPGGKRAPRKAKPRGFRLPRYSLDNLVCCSCDDVIVIMMYL